MLVENLKYEGILKDLNLEIIDDLLINELINRKIYFFNGNTKNLSNDIEDFEFGTRIYYNSKSYILNSEIQEEIYQEMNRYVIDVMSDFNHKRYHIESFLDSLIDNEDRINYLKKQYQIDYAKIFDDFEANLFIKEGDPKQESLCISMWGVKNWKEMIKDCLNDNIIKEYLKENIKNFDYDIFKRWSRLHELKSITDYYLKKIDEIKNQNFKVKSVLVFKDDGFEMFRHIDFNYQFEKNPAFYSHLYSFLISKDKIIKKTKENIAYQKFAESVNPNLKFPNMVITLDGSQNKKSDMFEAFETLLETY